MSDSVHVRNAKALQEAIQREIQARMELAGRVASIEAQVTMLRTAVEEAKQTMNVLRALTTGRGPTA